MLKQLIQKIRRPSARTAEILGFTLPELLMASCDEFPGLTTFFQFQSSGWQSFTNDDLRTQVHEAALGLRQLGLKKGDRVGFLLNSDMDFLVADLACATANLVSVPIDLSQTIENIVFSLEHSEAKALLVADLSLLDQMRPYLNQVQHLRWTIVFEALKFPEQQTSAPNQKAVSSQRPQTPIPPSIGLDLHKPHLATAIPPALEGSLQLSWFEILRTGRTILEKAPERLRQLKQTQSPQDLATIIYTPDESGELLGVMLSHENLTSTALASFAGMTGLKKGDDESVVTFLPLTHIFARMMLYGHLYYSHQVYFSTPRRVMKHLTEIRPTILTTVPLLLHRVYRRLQSFGKDPLKKRASGANRKFAVDVSRLKQGTHQWAMAIALRKRPNLGLARVEKVLATPIFRQWHKIFGGRVRYCLSGGAALDTEVARFFVGIGFPLYQGYGLTQTSSTVTFNHPSRNFPGTVGQVRDGVECAIAQDGEVLVKGTGNLLGYFNAPKISVADEEGWFHTGDLGYLDVRGNLTLLGSKKNLFKLTTGKYVTPIPLEQTLAASPLIQYALVVGAEQKYCAALIFVEAQALQQKAQKMGLAHYTLHALLDNPCIQALYQALIDEANCHFPYWSTIKKIHLLPVSDYPTSFRSYPLATIRNRLVQRFSNVIEQLYHESSDKREVKPPALNHCRDIPLVACPVTAQSLKTRAS